MVRRYSLAQQIVEELRRDGLGDHAPGTFLGTKRNLQARFGVSLGTVNEVVRILQLRGLVELRPGSRGGVFSATPHGVLKLAELALSFHGDPSVMREALEVRDMLEPALWLELATKHTQKTVRHLRGALEDMAAAIPDPAAYLQANWEFHRRAVAASRNSLLRTVYLGMLDLMTTALDDVACSPEMSQALVNGTFDNVEVHGRMVDAMSSGDQEQVLRAVAAHVAAGRQGRSVDPKRAAYEGRALVANARQP